ncbi:hypothetical protein [Amycolatopsis sp. H20-H5]|uniref:hypothetical protein n=1 Tax=Amycolatopsis sp. H20-H5 TaxID=3046309 RepID=UPI002DB83542|nr:hypothetical protein [Amycolatopsis sp. H20-H5]MEC3977921.1 hypothetical protein [Amycolatopsis sp. H20-H5]
MGRHTLVEAASVVTEANYAARYYRAHGAPHLYLKRELADSSIGELTPWCLVGKLAPELHRRRDIDPGPITTGAPFQVCHECRAELTLVRTGRIS